MCNIFPVHLLDKFLGENYPKTAFTDLNFYDCPGHAEEVAKWGNGVKKNLYGQKNRKKARSRQGRNYLKKGVSHRSAQIVHTNITTIYLYGRRDKKEVASLRF